MRRSYITLRWNQRRSHIILRRTQCRSYAIFVQFLPYFSLLSTLSIFSCKQPVYHLFWKKTAKKCAPISFHHPTAHSHLAPPRRYISARRTPTPHPPHLPRTPNNPAYPRTCKLQWRWWWLLGSQPSPPMQLKIRTNSLYLILFHFVIKENNILM